MSFTKEMKPEELRAFAARCREAAARTENTDAATGCLELAEKYEAEASRREARPSA